MLDISHVNKSYGLQEVLKDVTCRLHPGEKVGLVGRNGSGKSTLLKIIMGIETPDTGLARRAPASLTVGYLSQAHRSEKNQTALEAVQGSLPDCHRQWEAKRVLTGLGFREAQWDQTVQSLSGGEKTRLALARLLLQKPDYMLLDEPTNHLDIRMMEWLETWLNESETAAIIVSHDRRFLDNTVQKIWELEQGKLTVYTGSYSDYHRLKQVELMRSEENYRQQQREIQSIQEFIQRQLRLAARIQSGPKAGRDYYSRVGAKVAKRGDAGRKRLEQMNKVEKPRQETHARIGFGDIESSGQRVLSARDLGKAFGAKSLFQGLNLEITRGERVAVIGPNGAGKTTLLKLLLGEESPDSGDVRLGAGLRVGYLAQEHENQNPQNTVLEEVRSVSRSDESEVRTLLACLLFPGNDVFKRIEQLSEGERVRVALAKLLASGANLLVLDEPTNHLDIHTRERMEIALRSYEGTILLVSHDRCLLDQLADKTLLIEDSSATLYLGNYSYIEERRARSDDSMEELIRQIEFVRNKGSGKPDQLEES